MTTTSAPAHTAPAVGSVSTLYTVCTIHIVRPCHAVRVIEVRAPDGCVVYSERIEGETRLPLLRRYQVLKRQLGLFESEEG